MKPSSGRHARWRFRCALAGINKDMIDDKEVETTAAAVATIKHPELGRILRRTTPRAKTGRTRVEATSLRSCEHRIESAFALVLSEQPVRANESSLHCSARDRLAGTWPEFAARFDRCPSSGDPTVGAHQGAEDGNQDEEPERDEQCDHFYIPFS